MFDAETPRPSKPPHYETLAFLQFYVPAAHGVALTEG